MSVSEETFVLWAKGPGQTETDKCANAETSVRKAIKADSKLADLDISVFAQGSYLARTNIRQDSDVDICIRYNLTFFDQYPAGTKREDFGNTPGTMAYDDFKNMAENALVSYFGKSGVTRGKKAFDVHANTYRIDADVVPTFEYRWYTGKQNPDRSHHYWSGVAFTPDNGEMIKNWPKQTYDNGVARNEKTSRSYKRVIRILKQLRNKMQEDNILDAADVASFLIECLVWNASLEAFKHDTYAAIIRQVIIDTWNGTKTDVGCGKWGEVNELKYLFNASQPWTRQQANAFLQAAWNYIGYK